MISLYKQCWQSKHVQRNGDEAHTVTPVVEACAIRENGSRDDPARKHRPSNRQVAEVREKDHYLHTVGGGVAGSRSISDKHKTEENENGWWYREWTNRAPRRDQSSKNIPQWVKPLSFSTNMARSIIVLEIAKTLRFEEEIQSLMRNGLSPATRSSFTSQNVAIRGGNLKLDVRWVVAGHRKLVRGPLRPPGESSHWAFPPTWRDISSCVGWVSSMVLPAFKK